MRSSYNTAPRKLGQVKESKSHGVGVKHMPYNLFNFVTF